MREKMIKILITIKQIFKNLFLRKRLIFPRGSMLVFILSLFVFNFVFIFSIALAAHSVNWSIDPGSIASGVFTTTVIGAPDNIRDDTTVSEYGSSCLGVTGRFFGSGGCGYSYTATVTFPFPAKIISTVELVHIRYGVNSWNVGLNISGVWTSIMSGSNSGISGGAAITSSLSGSWSNVSAVRISSNGGGILGFGASHRAQELQAFGPGDHTLAIATAGTGSGITAGEGTYVGGAVVVLDATANPDSTFVGWSGDADCADGLVTIDADKTCTATFDLIPIIFAPTVILFGPGNVSEGNPINLDWSSTDADTCFASGDWFGDKALQGPEPAFTEPPGSYIFTLTCSNITGSAADSISTAVWPIATVNIGGPTILALPDPINIWWNSTDADYCEASGDWSGFKLPEGTEELPSVRGGYTYGLTCFNAGGSFFASHSVNIYQVPRCGISFEPRTVLKGSNYVTSTWSCANADSCIFSPVACVQSTSMTSGSFSGDSRLRPASTTVYILQCAGLDGTTQYTTTLNVVSEPKRREIRPR